MNNNNAKVCLKKLGGNLSPQQSKELEAKLKTVPDASVEKIRSIKTKSVQTTVILSSIFGLFGGGSFYLGQIKRGLCKVLFNVIIPFAVAMIFLFWLAPANRMYSEQGTIYSNFSNCKTANLSDFMYIYNLAGKDSQAAAEESDDNEGTTEISALYDLGFTDNINAAATLYNKAFENLSNYVSDIPDNFSQLRMCYTEPDTSLNYNLLERKFKAVNSDFAEFDSTYNGAESGLAKYSYSDYFTALNNVNKALTEIFPDLLKKQESENGQEDKKSLSAKLTEMSGEKIIKQDNELGKDLNSLINGINILHSTGLKEYVEALGLLNLQNILDTGVFAYAKFAFADTEEIITKFEKYYATGEDDLGALIQLDIDLRNSFANIIANISQSIISIMEPTDTIVATSIFSAINLINNIINPEKEDSGADNKSFEELVLSVIESLERLSPEAEETSLIPEILEELHTISLKYDSSDIAEKLAAIYEERSDEERPEEDSVTVNLVEEYETALKKFISENYLKNTDESLLALSNLVETSKNAAAKIDSDINSVNAIIESEVFENSVHFVSSHTSETLLQYYTGRQISLYQDNRGEELLIYYMCGAPRTEADTKLGISDTLADYYYTSQNIVNKMYNGAGKLATLEAIGRDLSNMASKINSLNSSTSDMVYSWSLTANLIATLFTVYLTIDLVIVIVYWIFEVFRDREKCYNLNYMNIMEELSIQ